MYNNADSRFYQRISKYRILVNMKINFVLVQTISAAAIAIVWQLTMNSPFVKILYSLTLAQFLAVVAVYFIQKSKNQIYFALATSVIPIIILYVVL
jgi:hypothetical protein